MESNKKKHSTISNMFATIAIIIILSFFFTPEQIMIPFGIVVGILAILTWIFR